MHLQLETFMFVWHFRILPDPKILFGPQGLRPWGRLGPQKFKICHFQMMVAMNQILIKLSHV